MVSLFHRATIGESKKERKKKKPQDEYIIICPITQGDHTNYQATQCDLLRTIMICFKFPTVAQTGGRG